MSLLTVKCEQGVACMTRSVQPSPKEFTVHYCHARDIEAAMLETPQHIVMLVICLKVNPKQAVQLHRSEHS